MGQVEPTPLKSAVTIAGALASQAAVLVPVLFYFGAVYTRAWYGYFGLDSGLLGYSVNDFVRRSVTPTFWPVILAMVLLLILLAARKLPLEVARRTRNEPRALRVWYVTMLASGVAVLAIAPSIRIFGVPSWFPLNDYLMPGSIVLGSVLIGYAVTLNSNTPNLWPAPSPDRGRLRPRPRASNQSPTIVLMIALFTLGLAGTLWGVGVFAAEQGLRDARDLAKGGFHDQPSVIVWSVDALGMDGPDVEATEIGTPGEKYRYYYGGLRLLDRTADAYLLIPQKWQARRDRVFIVPRADTIRIDISATHNN
ncbi:hypothetical protein DFR70_1011013 [Nocardia tenerifensis]|uniref:Uncharacterized protein n=1 Tax=Nocardia tenerifensis TaxID=228006 RepID=A0A318KFG9_9NOCA|nr:hypothetical protein [Nocardia tenerifensis]PXX71579.1 hypothetical protein DFR70_1011013 [Nocardia tenerifensis]